MEGSQEKNPGNLPAGPGPFVLVRERLGPLPLVNHYLGLLQLDQLLGQFIPTADARCRLPYAKGLGVLVRSILVEREPIYRHYAVVASFLPAAFGLSAAEAEQLLGDRLGRALDRLYDADRGSLLTQLVVQAVQTWQIKLDELHNDSTSIKFTGQYRRAKGRSIRGKCAPWITYGYSKDHRADLKQLLYIMTTTRDGGVPVQFRHAAGNTNDSATHIETWEALRAATGRADFLYVGDCKLCSYENLHHINQQGGRLVTVLPRSRLEDEIFRRWAQDNTPPWTLVVDRPNPRRKHGPRDRWYVHKFPQCSREGWPVIWVWSTLLSLKQKQGRIERLARAQQELRDMDQALQGKRPRKKLTQIEDAVQEMTERLQVRDYLRIKVWREELHHYHQEHKGRPGAQTRYRRETKYRWRLRWEEDQEKVHYDEKTDGMYPLLTNDLKLEPAQVLAAHKRQPLIEKRFEQLKTVHELAPLFLKNEARIEAFFFVYFIALMVQALMERQIRSAMEREGIEELPIYPEEMQCRRPTALQIFRLFAHLERDLLLKDGQVIQTFEPVLTDLQRQILGLLGVPKAVYQGAYRA